LTCREVTEGELFVQFVGGVVYIVVFNLLAALFSFYIYPSIQLALVKANQSFPTDKPETQYTRFESWSYGYLVKVLCDNCYDILFGKRRERILDMVTPW
jgi:hypothetical protein